MHTVRLVGELDRTSALILEAEIERACETRVDAIALDLTELTRIDPTGVAVVVFRGGWCERRGCRLVLIAASRSVRMAFAQARASERLHFAHPADELLASPAVAGSLPAPAAARITVSSTSDTARFARATAVAAEGAPAHSSSVLHLTGQGRGTRQPRRRRRSRG